MERNLPQPNLPYCKFFPASLIDLPPLKLMVLLISFPLLIPFHLCSNRNNLFLSSSLIIEYKQMDRLFGELIHCRVFSHDFYVRGLISRGFLEAQHTEVIIVASIHSSINPSAIPNRRISSSLYPLLIILIHTIE